MRKAALLYPKSKQERETGAKDCKTKAMGYQCPLSSEPHSLHFPPHPSTASHTRHRAEDQKSEIRSLYFNNRLPGQEG
jgi:hypothetical protein